MSPSIGGSLCCNSFFENSSTVYLASEGHGNATCIQEETMVNILTSTKDATKIISAAVGLWK
jgi:hypothetical protein